MPTARESLMDAALSALVGRPWPAVRMVDVAAAAGVSRQTLYNEFGGKEGLGRALVRREADVYLRGVDRALAERSGPAERLVEVAQWTLACARSSALTRALLTGAWSERLPAPSIRTPAPTASAPAAAPISAPAPVAHAPAVPAQRRPDVEVPGPAELVAAVRDRALAVLEREAPGADPVELGRYCETAVRLGLSFVVAPAGRPEDHAGQLRALLAAVPGAPRVSAPSPRSVGRSRPR